MPDRLLERFKAPRTLNLSQQADIRARLGKFGPHRVDVIIIGDAQEIANLAGMIVAAFPEGWNVNVFKAVSGPNVSGVLVGPHTGSDRNVNAATETLISVLQSNGIASGPLPQFSNELPMALMGNWDAQNIAPIRILISAKP